MWTDDRQQVGSAGSLAQQVGSAAGRVRRFPRAARGSADATAARAAQIVVGFFVALVPKLYRRGPVLGASNLEHREVFPRRRGVYRMRATSRQKGWAWTECSRPFCCIAAGSVLPSHACGALSSEPAQSFYPPAGSLKSEKRTLPDIRPWTQRQFLPAGSLRRYSFGRRAGKLFRRIRGFRSVRGAQSPNLSPQRPRPDGRPDVGEPGAVVEGWEAAFKALWAALLTCASGSCWANSLKR